MPHSMGLYFVGASSTLLLCALSLSCVQKPGVDDEPDSEASAAVTEAARVDLESAELQHEISQVLWGCFAVGADLVGTGDVPGAKDVLRKCFADDMASEAVLPPAYASLGFTTSGGADGWVEVANQIYRSFHFTRAQHLITNIVIKKTGPDTAIVNSGALAVHVYPDERVFNATVKFVDDFRRMNGVWKITHRAMTLTSVSQAAAWVP